MAGGQARRGPSCPADWRARNRQVAHRARLTRSAECGSAYVAQLLLFAPSSGQCALSPNHPTHPRWDDNADDKRDKLKVLLAQSSSDLAQDMPLFAALLSIPGGDHYRLPEMTPHRREGPNARRAARSRKATGHAPADPDALRGSALDRSHIAGVVVARH
jgi:hypothetical protein